MDTGDKGPQIVAVVVTMLTLATTAVTLRWWPRLLSLQADFWWDDGAACLALPFNLALNAVLLYWVSIGLGKHAGATTGDAASQLFNFWIANFFYNTSLVLVKGSVLLFYARVLRSSTGFQALLWSTGILALGTWLALDVLLLVDCQPLARFWFRQLQGHCLPLQSTLVGSATPNVVTDLLLLLLPIPKIFQLPVDRRRKWILTAYFALGYCVLAVSVSRLIVTISLGKNLESDFSWTIADNAMLLSIESSVAIISICLPRIFNMLRKGVAHLSASSSGALSPVDGLNSPAPLRLGSLALPTKSWGRSSSSTRAVSFDRSIISSPGSLF